MDNKGLLVVGNYGTGKSHLLSVMSSVAENENLQSLLTNDVVRKVAATKIAGKFKVLRIEIGSTEMPLREISVTSSLEEKLDEGGFRFAFPSVEKVKENKSGFRGNDGGVPSEVPGSLACYFVVDELLDYLSWSRRDQPLYFGSWLSSRGWRVSAKTSSSASSLACRKPFSTADASLTSPTAWVV